MQKPEDRLKWFATRAIRDKSYVLKYLECEGIRHEGIADIKSLIFVQCSDAAIRQIRLELYDRLLIYRDAERREAQQIPDRVMQTFLIMSPFHDEPVIYLSIDDPHFFDGKHKRVKAGVFAGCEGIIKRIKGERRLIVRINDHAAIATPYIPQELLEEIG